MLAGEFFCENLRENDSSIPQTIDYRIQSWGSLIVCSNPCSWIFRAIQFWHTSKANFLGHFRGSNRNLLRQRKQTSGDPEVIKHQKTLHIRVMITWIAKLCASFPCYSAILKTSLPANELQHWAPCPFNSIICIWANGIVFHQHGFSWNFGDFPS